MMKKSVWKADLHTHTSFCDGKNSPEEMVRSAVEKGFDVLGFSGHSYTPFDETYCMSLKIPGGIRRRFAGWLKHIGIRSVYSAGLNRIFIPISPQSLMIM